MSEIRDLIIIGSGPAGLSAAIYAKRAMLNTLVVEKEMQSGGQIINAEKVDNYLGIPEVNGFELAQKFRKHAEALDVEFLNARVQKLEDNGPVKDVILDNGTKLQAKNIIIATGASHRELGAKGEKEFRGAGVSYCATCDGFFFRKRDVAVIGGGDVALGDALYLAGLCNKVYLIHRRDTLRGAKSLQEKVFNTPNIEFVPNSTVQEIIGDDMVTTVNLGDREIPVAGVFIAVGMNPQSGIAEGICKLDDAGYIVAGEDCKTSAEGIFAVGDVRTKELRQIVTAVADGAVAVNGIRGI